MLLLMGRITPIAFLLCAVLCACTTVQSLKTSGRPTTGVSKLDSLRMVFDPTPQGTIQVESMGNNITTQMEANARTGTRQLIALFSKDLEQKFSAHALKFGLTISPAASAQLKISIIGEHSICNADRCKSMLVLKGTLPVASAQGANWTFRSEVGQPGALHAISDGILDVFADELLSAMRSDGLI